jgi:hypothetical protein
VSLDQTAAAASGSVVPMKSIVSYLTAYLPN